MKPWENSDPNWNKPKGRERNKIEIKVWMLRKGITVSQLAKEAGYKRVTLASSTVAGLRNSRKILRLLINKGCPVEFLDLPEDMRETA